MLARAVEATHLGPIIEAVPDLEVQAGPVRGPAYVQYDPETERPVEANRPGVPSGAHGAIRVWQGCRDQIAHFNAAAAPGEAAHFCGEDPCTASNPGS